jgi:hypothetical protein
MIRAVRILIDVVGACTTVYIVIRIVATLWDLTCRAYRRFVKKDKTAWD